MLYRVIAADTFSVRFLVFSCLFLKLCCIFIVKGKREEGAIYLIQKQYEKGSWHIWGWTARADYPSSLCLAVRVLIRTHVPW